MPERVDERALLVSDLGAWLKVLHGAAAAAAGTVAELGATGLDALNALAVNLATRPISKLVLLRMRS